MIKLPKVIKAVGNVGKTGSKKGKEGDKTVWKRFTREDNPKLTPKKKNTKSNRLKYMGRTPGKSSKTGKNVTERMKQEGKIRGYGSKLEFKASNNNWYPIRQADMAHKVDAVTWWNKVGRKYGAKSKEVREFMLDPDNYYLEYYKINRSQGGKLKETYLPPLK